MEHGDVLINYHGKVVRPRRLPSNLYRFMEGTGEARCILDSVTSLQNGADLIWIETEKPHIGQIGAMMDEIRKVIPNAKLVYNNSPSFNWTLNFRQQVYDAMEEAGKDTSDYDRDNLMDEKYDATELGLEADEKIRTFQADAAKQAGIFHHLITLPTYHTAALSTDNLAKEYFGENHTIIDNIDKKAYLSALSISQSIVVTCDSSSMISEAALTGKPIYVANILPKKNDKRFQKFRKLFRELNIIRNLGEEEENWNYQKLDETNRVAKIIKQKINS